MTSRSLCLTPATKPTPKLNAWAAICDVKQLTVWSRRRARTSLKLFEGIGYRINVGIVLDPSHANFNGGANGAGNFHRGGVHGTWFWVDRTYDIVVVGMLQQQDGGNPMTGHLYPVPNVGGISRSIIYGELVDPAL